MFADNLSPHLKQAADASTKTRQRHSADGWRLRNSRPGSQPGPLRRRGRPLPVQRPVPDQGCRVLRRRRAQVLLHLAQERRDASGGELVLLRTYTVDVYQFRWITQYICHPLYPKWLKFDLLAYFPNIIFAVDIFALFPWYWLPVVLLDLIPFLGHHQVVLKIQVNS